MLTVMFMNNFLCCLFVCKVKDLLLFHLQHEYICSMDRSTSSARLRMAELLWVRRGNLVGLTWAKQHVPCRHSAMPLPLSSLQIVLWIWKWPFTKTESSFIPLCWDRKLCSHTSFFPTLNQVHTHRPSSISLKKSSKLKANTGQGNPYSKIFYTSKIFTLVRFFCFVLFWNSW